jgi:hypothetical protein
MSMRASPRWTQKTAGTMSSSLPLRRDPAAPAAMDLRTVRLEGEEARTMTRVAGDQRLSAATRPGQSRREGFSSTRATWGRKARAEQRAS